MGRSSLRDKNWKSKPLNERKRVVKVPKPQYALASGVITCPKCHLFQTVEAHAEVVTEFPSSKFWYIGRCKNKQSKESITVPCDTLITGWAIIE